MNTTQTIPDELNPNQLLTGIATDLLVAIASGQIDIQALALHQLQGRGLDADGKWVGSKN